MTVQSQGSTSIFGAFVMCTTGPPAEIRGIRAAEPRGDFVIDGWGGRPNPMLSGGTSTVSAHYRRLSDLGFDTRAVVVTNRCSDSANAGSVELAVEVLHGRDRTAWTKGLLVDYVAAGRRGVTLIPGTLVLCGAAGEDPPSDFARCP